MKYFGIMMTGQLLICSITQSQQVDSKGIHTNLSHTLVVPSEATDTGSIRTKTLAPNYSEPNLVIYTGADGKFGVRATIRMAASVPGSSWLISINFCDDSKLSLFRDGVGQYGNGPYDFYLPVAMLSFVLDILRKEPKRFVEYTWSNPSGSGYPIGNIGFR